MQAQRSAILHRVLLFLNKGGSVLAITEEEAQEVDAAVARLIQRDEEMGRVLKLYYFSGCNASLVARAFEINRKRAIVLVQCGTAWVDAKLEAA